MARNPAMLASGQSGRQPSPMYSRDQHGPMSTARHGTDVIVGIAPHDGEDGADGDGEDGDMGENVICVPTSALALPDEQEHMEAPELHDIVTANIEGKVCRIKGDQAYVCVTAVNGEAIDEQGNAEDNENSQPDGQGNEEAGLTSMANDLDQSGSY